VTDPANIELYNPNRALQRGERVKTATASLYTYEVPFALQHGGQTQPNQQIVSLADFANADDAQNLLQLAQSAKQLKQKNADLQKEVGELNQEVAALRMLLNNIGYQVPPLITAVANTIRPTDPNAANMADNAATKLTSLLKQGT
jgi:hypothetical protein